MSDKNTFPSNDKLDASSEEMSSYKLKYKLKQQTPMIHFQYNEVGATLRATEVKPKLDRFITEKMGGSVPKEWLIDSEKRALNYKIRIVANGEPVVSDQINKMYFANMGDNTEKKQTVFYENEVDLDIICFIDDLRKKIKEYIIDFFLNTNFGTRQSKGFGGFLCKKKDDEYLSWEKISDNSHYKNKKLMWTAYGFDSIDAAMNNAAMLYAIMKSGINMSKDNKAWNFATRYNKIESEQSIKKILKEIKKEKVCDVSEDELKNFINNNKNKKDKKNLVNMANGWKSCVSIINKIDGQNFDDKIEKAIKEEETYFYDKNKYIKGFVNSGAGLNTGGDKAFIKSKDSLWRNDGKSVEKRNVEKNNKEHDSYKFLRILLGMSDHYEFKDPDKKRVGTVYVRNFEGVSVDNIEKSKDKELKEDIVRFKSPITMKIYKEGIIFIFNEIPKELLGKEFYISKNKAVEKKELNSEYFIKTPDKWNWNDFIVDFISHYNGNKNKINILKYLYGESQFLTLETNAKKVNNNV